MKIILHPLFFQQQLPSTEEAPGTMFGITGTVLSATYSEHLSPKSWSMRFRFQAQKQFAQEYLGSK